MIGRVDPDRPSSYRLSLVVIVDLDSLGYFSAVL